MSWEAWGDDDAGRYDHLLDAGWWTSEQVDDVRAAIDALFKETLYENADSGKGISTRFLARITLLRDAAGFEVDVPLLDEAKALLAEPPSATPDGTVS